MYDQQDMDDGSAPLIRQRLRLAMLMVAAMLVGEIAFLILILTLRASSQQFFTSTIDLPPLLPLGLLLVVTVMALLVRSLFGRKLAVAHDLAQTLQVYFTMTIVSCGLFEAAAFFCIITLLLASPSVPPLIGLALALIAQGCFFPTPARFHRLRQQATQRQQLRHTPK